MNRFKGKYDDYIPIAKAMGCLFYFEGIDKRVKFESRATHEFIRGRMMEKQPMTSAAHDFSHGNNMMKTKHKTVLTVYKLFSKRG